MINQKEPIKGNKTGWIWPGFVGSERKWQLIAVMLLVISVPLYTDEPLSIVVAVVEANSNLAVTSARADNASARVLEVVESNQTPMQQFIEVAESKYSIGKGLQQDALLAQLELSNAKVIMDAASLEMKGGGIVARLPVDKPYRIRTKTEVSDKG